MRERETATKSQYNGPYAKTAVADPESLKDDESLFGCTLSTTVQGIRFL
jgi:hypothetical protein